MRRPTNSAPKSSVRRSKSHRDKGPGLIESIYERCLLRELELRSIPATTQKLVHVEYKGLVFDEPLSF
jgi:GxxExxY protein